MKTWRVVLAPEAIDDLESIETLIAIRDTPDAATRYINRIKAFCNQLTHAPARGTVRDDLRPGIRLLGFERRVSVAIWLHNDEVHILRVFYAGQRVSLDPD